MGTSHDFAKNLRDTATVLESRPETYLRYAPEISVYFTEKDSFLTAVRALKPGKKKMDDNYIRFYPEGTILCIYADRHTVCHKVQEAQWSCEPLLSPEEDAEIETVA